MITFLTADVSVSTNIPLAEFAVFIYAEIRGFGPINTNYSLGVWLQYLLEKWVGVCLYQEFVDQHGVFNQEQAIAVYGSKLMIMATGIYTTTFSILRRNQVESSYHFGGCPEVLVSEQCLKGMRLSQVLTKSAQWAWTLAIIDELCLQF